MKAFKRIAFSLALTSIVSAFSIVSGASAVSPATPQEVPANKALIKPSDTDGRNISYHGSFHTRLIAGPLPISTYGTVPLTVVQYYPFSSDKPKLTYQFRNHSGTKASTKHHVPERYEDENYTITFTDVPKGTKDEPIFLYIENAVSESRNVNVNGYTSY
ncbi:MULTISPECIES: hypothetical protein [Brevibacillus]|uniref:hypothetical protein n=1 Tax=Brevibacillus TaxID=55080 RepID=UPI001E6209F9|nr:MULTISPECIES: hypothetical protein [Brevibacillus]MCE0453766.1 hypothetical protein [Brevibacillus sp. AF8]UKK97756.1 hypothetical protein FO446_10135 [Brevibacillus brevis]